MTIINLGAVVAGIVAGIFLFLLLGTIIVAKVTGKYKNAKSWQDYIPKSIPAHAWQLLIGLIVSHGIIMGFSMETWKEMWHNGWLFWIASKHEPLARSMAKRATCHHPRLRSA